MPRNTKSTRSQTRSGGTVPPPSSGGQSEARAATAAPGAFDFLDHIPSLEIGSNTVRCIDLCIHVCTYCLDLHITGPAYGQC